MSFSDRCDHVSEYYHTIRPFPENSAYNGDLVVGEATADMGGIRVTLSMASKQQGFDYDKYFRQYATLWQTSEKEEDEVAQLENDEHPLNYLRINVGLQQFDEFYTTYGVKEGDGMYLSEDKRIAVW